jgi:hypothetical protein
MFRRIRRAGTCHRVVLIGLIVVGLLMAAPAVGYADAIHTHLILAGPKSINQVIAGLRNWLMGILAGIATLFLVLAGVYYATAGGDPGQVEKAKGALRNALVGYAIAVLAPVLLSALQGIVGS